MAEVNVCVTLQVAHAVAGMGHTYTSILYAGVGNLASNIFCTTLSTCQAELTCTNETQNHSLYSYTHTVKKSMW